MVKSSASATLKYYSHGLVGASVRLYTEHYDCIHYKVLFELLQK